MIGKSKRLYIYTNTSFPNDLNTCLNLTTTKESKTNEANRSGI